MRIIKHPPFLAAALALVLVALAGPAWAAGPGAAGGGTNPYNVSWAALDPGQDWAAVVLRSIFPIPGATAGTLTGNEPNVIQLIVGQFTGFVSAVACAFVAYSVIMHIHRAAESSRVLGTGQTWMSVVRVGFAGVMMFPLGGGFSAGQWMVMQGAMTGIGMARAVYASALQAVGPDAIVIAQPMIPGTKGIVYGLIDSELCMDLLNLASNTVSTDQPLAPIPNPITVNDANNGDVITWQYSLSAGNQVGTPVCGVVTVRDTSKTQQMVAGIDVNMSGVQQAVLYDVVNGSIRNQVAGVAQQLWTTKNASALVPLQAVLGNATAAYTRELTSAAQNVGQAINAAVQTRAASLRNGQTDTPGTVQMQTLGWTAAGAYYLEIANLNAATLSLAQSTPVVTPPTYDGLPPKLSSDLAAPMAVAKSFMETLNTVVLTSDGTAPPSGLPSTMANATNTNGPKNIIDDVTAGLGIGQGALSLITGYITPSAQYWTDPFGGLMALGQILVNITLLALGASVALASSTLSLGSAIFNTLTGNWAAVGGTLVGSAVMSVLGTPIFIGLLGLLIPGLTIAYVLPMVPCAMWIAGVLGWLVLVCEAMIAVPLWMLAHMTIGGEGLHGRGLEGWSMLFSIVFRPTMMVIGLFLGYFVFDCMSWLIRESFSVATSFVFAKGYIVNNLIGVAVMLMLFIGMHITAAMMSFRLVAQLPHQLPRMIGFGSGGRVDMDDFQERAVGSTGRVVAIGAQRTLSASQRQVGQATQGRLQDLRQRRISGPGMGGAQNGATARGMDTTLQATSDTSGSGGTDV